MFSRHFFPEKAISLRCQFAYFAPRRAEENPIRGRAGRSRRLSLSPFLANCHHLDLKKLKENRGREEGDNKVETPLEVALSLIKRMTPAGRRGPFGGGRRKFDWQTPPREPTSVTPHKSDFFLAKGRERFIMHIQSLSLLSIAPSRGGRGEKTTTLVKWASSPGGGRVKRTFPPNPRERETHFFMTPFVQLKIEGTATAE